MTFQEDLTIRTEAVNDVVLKYLPKEEGFQKTVLAAMNYSMNAGGKRLRPLIMQETYRLFDGNGRVVEPFMAAIEMIHTSSLIHDDLPCMDNDTLRRGLPSTWAKFGEDMGVLAGDALMMYALETASQAFLLSPALKNVGEAIRILTNKTGIFGMIGGQTLDVEKTGLSLTPEEMKFIYSYKTGALLEASMQIGAVLADASQEDVKTCGLIANKVGLAFQIQDDILDVTSSTETLGKPVHSDEKNEKTTFVTLYGLDEARSAVKRLTDQAIDLLHKLTGENVFLNDLLVSLVERDK